MMAKGEKYMTFAEKKSIFRGYILKIAGVCEHLLCNLEAESFSIGAGIGDIFYTNVDIESCLRTQKSAKKAVMFNNLY
jgi:hypothetical protein